MSKSPIQNGLILFATTMFLFFVVYYFFANANYWEFTMKANAFVMPFVYTIGGFTSVYILRGKDFITFPQAFKQAFTTLFIGGFLSILSMFLFLNYGDTDARDLLNHQYISTEIKNLDTAYQQQKKDLAAIKNKDQAAEKSKELEKNYSDAKKGREVALQENRNYFSFSFLSAVFGGIILFYLLLSIVIAAFLKNKKRYE